MNHLQRGWGLFLLTLPGLAAAAEPPVLGSRPSGIVDEGGKQVGQGPPLGLVGPAPKDDPRERYAGAVQWLRGFLTNLATLEKDLVAIKMALRAGSVEIKELRDAMRSLRVTRDKAYTASLREACDGWISSKDAESFKLVSEQEALLAGARRRWDDLTASLADQVAASAEFPEFQQALQALGRTVAQKQQLSTLELTLAAGRRQEFDKLAVAAEQNAALQMPVLLLRCADYLEAGEGRLALYAARLGAERYPDNPAFRVFGQGLDVSYLRAISQKTVGDGAEVHALWNRYAGDVSDSVVKQFFFGSLRHTSDLATGQAYNLELVQKDAMVRATAEHNGLEVLWRLRDKGLSFEQIQALNADEMQQRLGLSQPLWDDSVQMLHVSLQAAFANPDVKRLLHRSKEQFDLDTGKSYYGAGEFDTGLLEYAVDAVNVKNVLLFMGPGAVVKYGQAEAGLLTRLSRLGVAEREVATSFEGAVTVRDWLLARPSMQEALGYLAKTRAGAGLEALRAARYDAALPVRAGLAVAELGAQFLLFEAGGRVGQALGGDFGEFIGQALAMLAGNPVADLEAREAKAMRQTAAEMATRRAKWEAFNGVLKEVRLPLRQAVDSLEAGTALSAAQATALEAVAGRAGQVASEARAGASALEQAAADEAEALANAAQAAQRGDAAAAGNASAVADDLARRAAEGADELQRARQALEQAAAQAPPPVLPPPPTKAELARTFRAGDPIPPRPAPPPVAPEPTGKSARECVDLANRAMQEGRFAEAQRHYRAGYELEQLDKRLDAFEEGIWRSRFREARQAERYAEVVTQRGSNQVLAKQIDQAMTPFSDAVRSQLRQAEGTLTVAIPGTTGGPRKVFLRQADGTRGELVGIWKPAAPPNGRNLNQMQQDGQLVAEVLYARLAQRLGLRVPHAEPLTLHVPNEAGLVEATSGVIIRYIPQSRELQGLTPGMVAVLKQQMARFRVLQVLTGNYDIHLGNWRIDAAGRVWSIDAGMATLESTIPGGYGIDDVARCFGVDLNATGMVRSGNQALDLTRVWRDAYRNHADRHTAQVIQTLDRLIVGRDLTETARQAKRITPAEFNKLFDELAPGHTAGPNVKDTWQQRWEHLEALLNERWPGTTPLRTGAAWLDLLPAVWRQAA
ncbi:MAG: hypothetical protein IT204_16835 [Fimbriimonadaceae bacterium]|nr:hypothetical protein [Fimbriimonadaceae bacterium]